jgi:hypothetical protein
MGDPLDDALGNFDRARDFSKSWQGEEAWHQFLARKKVVDAIEGFLRRMGTARNPGTEKLKIARRHKENIWSIRWIIRESRGGFYLTTDGRLKSSDYGCVNDWAPYREAQFFQISGHEAKVMEQQGPPDLTTSQGLDVKYMPEADAIVMGMASLIREAIG